MARTFFKDFNRLDEEETPVTVEYTFRPGAPDTYDASRGGPGGWDPGYPAECEIIKAWKTDPAEGPNEDVTLTAAEEEKFCQYILENHAADHDDDYE